EARAREQFKAHASALSSAEAALAQTDAALARLTQERGEALKDYERHQSELKALAGRLGASIAKDPAFAAKQAELAELTGVAEQAMRKTQQAEQDRDAKGKPYRDDPLFMYLWEAGYG